MSVGSVSGFYPGGRPSGLPDDIVQQLVNAKRTQNLDPLQQDKQSVQQQKDVYSKLDSQLVKMAGSADSLKESEAFQAKSVSSSNEDVVSASVDNTARESSYNVSVSQLAKAHTQVIGTNDDATADSTVSKGIDAPDDSSLITDDMEISFNHQGTRHSFTTDGETTLSSLAEKISSDENAVTASVSNVNTVDTPEYVMTLKSEVTGKGEQRITKDSGNPGVDITDNQGDGRNLFSAGAADQEEVVAGQNASFSVDGVSYERTSNEVSDAVDGMTLNLNGQGTDVGVSVEQDISSVVQQVQSFVDSFNNTNQFISKLSDYNKEEDKAGPLMGSTVARSADSKMSRAIMEPVQGTADEPYQYLNQVGIELQRDGNLEFDSQQFKEEFTKNPQAVEKLFVGDNGAAGRMESALSNFTDDIDGSLTYKLESIDSHLDRIDDQIQQEQQRLQSYRDRTIQRFSHMEQAISRYQSMESELQNWMSQNEE